MRGEHKAFVIDGLQLQSLEIPVAAPCAANSIGFTTLPVGPGHLINPRWALRETIVTFAELHNLMVIDRWQQDALTSCDDLAADDLAPGDDAR